MAEHEMNLVTCQAGEPGKDVVADAGRVVAFEVAQGAHQGFLHHFFAEVAIAAHTVETESVQRLQGGLGEGRDGVGVAREGAAVPTSGEGCPQTRSSFAFPNASRRPGSDGYSLMCARRKEPSRKRR